MNSKFYTRPNKTMLAAIITLALTAGATAQAAANPQVQQRLAALKQSIAANQQKLHKYQWTEVQQMTLKGDTKPQQQFMCQYGPDGKVEKYPMGPQQQPSGGRLKQKMIEKKKAEMQDYMADVKSLLAEYVPPNPQKIQQAAKSGNVAISKNPSSGLVNLTFKDFALPGDQMVVAFDPTAKKIAGINVNTYMGQAKDAVTLEVSFSTLPDGTNYVEKTVLNAAAKQMVVTTLNTNYHTFGQPGM
jgi:hypothetical protein